MKVSIVNTVSGHAGEESIRIPNANWMAKPGTWSISPA